jgi:hypothetical protein
MMNETLSPLPYIFPLSSRLPVTPRATTEMCIFEALTAGLTEYQSTCHSRKRKVRAPRSKDDKDRFSNGQTPHRSGTFDFVLKASVARCLIFTILLRTFAVE